MLEDFALDLDIQLLKLLDSTDLTWREREVLDARWMHDGETTLLTDVAKARHVTRERVRAIEAKAFRKLREQGAKLDKIGKQADDLQKEMQALKARLCFLQALREGRPREAQPKKEEA